MADAPGSRSRLPLLELRGVTHTYPPRDGGEPLEVVRDLDLVVAPGAFACVAGRSGSGKTTVLSIAAGLLAPTAGEVRWDGERLVDLDAGSTARRRREMIGFVFQSAALISSLTAAENVALPGMSGRTKSIARARVNELLELVGVANRAANFPSELSGGEAQRVAIARALYADPPLLIVDEPTANVDRRTADGLIAVLKGLARLGRGVLVASHDEHLLAGATELVRLA
jgi:ABC-type lipoprotein export system ATPase subunit